MNSIFGSLGVGLLCGLVAWVVLVFFFPNVPAKNFQNLIGLIVLVGIAIAAWVARRRRASPSSKRSGRVKKK